jgi:hypothetical protein
MRANPMKSERLAAFENVRGQIGCCGIWCGSCAVGNGSLRTLTAKYEAVIQSHGLEHWAPDDIDYKEFVRSLEAVRRVASCGGCRKGGGRDDCKLRSCCGSKGLKDCLECGERSACEHHDLLEHMRSGARAAGLFVKESIGPNEPILREWETKVRSSWPSFVLFDGED